LQRENKRRERRNREILGKFGGSEENKRGRAGERSGKGTKIKKRVRTPLCA